MYNLLVKNTLSRKKNIYLLPTKITYAMILVVESGSTKADWMLIKESQHIPYTTKGFNPFFHNKEDILIELNDHLELDLIKDEVTQIFFYGAGCSSKKLNAKIENGLSAFFTKAKIVVDHDLKACAVSLYEKEPIVACILGTGSNSCYFDGKKITENSDALGYILGDEGSGSYFGKIILSDFIYNRLPEKMMVEMTRLGFHKDNIIENVYMKDNANVFIASFMPVLVRNRELDYSQRIIKNGFSEFIDKHVLCYPESKKAAISFVGSVACLLKQELEDVCKSKRLRFGKVIRRPLENLVHYHLSPESMKTENFNIKINKN
jgi:glucosamine kinase